MKTVIRGFRLDPELDEKLSLLARRMERTRSGALCYLIRRASEAMLQESPRPESTFAIGGPYAEPR